MTLVRFVKKEHQNLTLDAKQQHKFPITDACINWSWEETM